MAESNVFDMNEIVADVDFILIFRVIAVENDQVSNLKSETRKWEGLVDLHIDEVDEIIVLLRDMGRVVSFCEDSVLFVMVYCAF